MKVINILLGETLDEVREGFRKINIKGANITILGTQPGTGKSTFMLDFLTKSKIKNIGVATQRHNLLKEFENQIPNFNHWYGFEKKCENESMKKLTGLGLNASIICSVCKKKHCSYKLQFKDKNRCGFPTEYLNTKYVEGFQLMFVEESIYGYKTYKWNEEELIKGLKAFQQDKYLYRTEKAIKEFDSDYFLFPINIENKTILDIIKNQQDTSLRNCIKEKDYDRIKEILKFDYDTVLNCLTEQKTLCYKPTIFNVFKWSETIPIILNHASFSEDIFKQLLERYENEYGDIEITVKIYTSRIQNKNTNVYRIGFGSYSKSKLLLDGIPKEAFTILDKLLTIYEPSEIGIITYKSLIPDIINKYNKVLTNDNFFNTSGMNKFQNCKVLMIIGSTIMGKKIERHNALLVGMNQKELPPDYKMFDFMSDTHVYHTYPRFEETELRDIAKLDDFEMYDTIHRVRGLLGDKIIFLFGRLPVKIYNEFSVMEICDKEELETVLEGIEMNNLDKKKEKFSKIILNEIERLYYQGLTATEIAKKLDIRRKGSSKYETSFVKNHIEDIKKEEEKRKILSEIKFGNTFD